MRKHTTSEAFQAVKELSDIYTALKLECCKCARMRLRKWSGATLERTLCVATWTQVLHDPWLPELGPSSGSILKCKSSTSINRILMAKVVSESSALLLLLLLHSPLFLLLRLSALSFSCTKILFDHDSLIHSAHYVSATARSTLKVK